MDEEIRDLLMEEIKEEFQKLSDVQTGSKEKSSAIEDLAKRYKMSIEEERTELDCIEKSEAREREERLKKEQVKNLYFRIGVEAASIILPLIFYAVWMKRGFKFEETGTYTSTTFRGLFNRFRPTK